ncbi:hypothetical protein SAMN00808754_1638 [Thermanaeromonas toyohensis ToBE]|uniref:Uncharacterized protein n=1 Tax=Thermanaeromonas toyohensis ToBE TaxID=698762 RepID=A0A1W1VTS5_9FIRM|nr:hypothetical protein [Thermanaeromonas toyohensis]SMB96765.1 hypothetical protein SAMN00808754_1638 [Thermanaeromonas toyohensis ToBE]
MVITLIEEVSPGDVIRFEEAEEKLWNSPPPVEARYRLAGGDEGRIDRDTWNKLNKQYWGEDVLEEFDMFFALPRWRLFGDAPDILRAAGYDVNVVTLEEQAAERRRRYMAAVEEQKKREEERRQQRKRAEGLIEQETCGLVKAGEVAGFYELFDEEYSVRPLGFYHSGLDFLSVGRSRLTRKKMVLHGYGNAVDTYCDPETAEELFRRTWEFRVKVHGGGELGVARAGFSALIHARFYGDCHGAEASRWIVGNLMDKFLPLLQEKCVVCACRNVWKGFDIEQARQVCQELGIRFREDPERHGVFLLEQQPGC